MVETGVYAYIFVCLTKNAILLFFLMFFPFNSSSLHANLVAIFLKVKTGATVAGSSFYCIIYLILFFSAKILMYTHPLE